MLIFGNFSGPRMTSKPRGDRMDQKCCQNASPKPPEWIQSPKLVPTGCQMVSQGAPKMTPKLHFGGSWGTGAPQRASGGSPGTPRGSKWSQNGTEVDQKKPKIEQLNDERCLPLQPRRHERSSLNAPRQGSALPERRVKSVLEPCFNAWRKTS